MTSRSVSIRAYPWLVLPWLFLCAAPLASERPHFQSQLRDDAITVDGRYDDWYGNLQPFEQAPVSVQFLNDKDFLYMRLTASSASERMQILRWGFTVWFDPAGGTKKHFGVRYPVVERGSEREPAPGDRLDVLGPGKDDGRMLTRDHAPGIDVAIRSEQGTLQYELKVPLAKTADHPYAIDAIAGTPIGVGLEAGKRPQQSFRGGPGGAGFGGGGIGGRGGGIGGRGGGMGGRRGGGREGGYEAPKPLKGWGVVTTAPVPAR